MYSCTGQCSYIPLIEEPIFLSLIRLSRLSITVKKSVGESTDPCFTPRPMRRGSDRWLFNLTWLGESVYQDLRRRLVSPAVSLRSSLSLAQYWCISKSFFWQHNWFHSSSTRIMGHDKVRNGQAGKTFWSFYKATSRNFYIVRHFVMKGLRHTSFPVHQAGEKATPFFHSRLQVTHTYKL